MSEGVGGNDDREPVQGADDAKHAPVEEEIASVLQIPSLPYELHILVLINSSNDRASVADESFDLVQSSSGQPIRVRSHRLTANFLSNALQKEALAPLMQELHAVVVASDAANRSSVFFADAVGSEWSQYIHLHANRHVITTVVSSTNPIIVPSNSAEPTINPLWWKTLVSNELCGVVDAVLAHPATELPLRTLSYLVMEDPELEPATTTSAPSSPSSLSSSSTSSSSTSSSSTTTPHLLSPLAKLLLPLHLRKHSLYNTTDCAAILKLRRATMEYVYCSTWNVIVFESPNVLQTSYFRTFLSLILSCSHHLQTFHLLLHHRHFLSIRFHDCLRDALWAQDKKWSLSTLAGDALDVDVDLAADKASGGARTRFLARLHAAVCTALDVTHNETTNLTPLTTFQTLKTLAEDASQEDNVPVVWLALGRCFQRGVGTTVDLVQATEWYSKAAEAGMLLAVELLAECDIEAYSLCNDRLQQLQFEADALNRADLYLQLAANSKCGETDVAKALFIAVRARHPRVREVYSFRPAMPEVEVLEGAMLRGAIKQRDPLAMFTLLHTVDFRHVLPAATWLRVMHQLANDAGLVQARVLVARELVLGNRYFLEHPASLHPFSVNEWTEKLWNEVDSLRGIAGLTIAGSFDADDDNAISRDAGTSAGTGAGCESGQLTALMGLAELCLADQLGVIPCQSADQSNGNATDVTAIGKARDTLQCLRGLTATPSTASYVEEEKSRGKNLLSSLQHACTDMGYGPAGLLLARLLICKACRTTHADTVKKMMSAVCPVDSPAAVTLCRALFKAEAKDPSFHITSSALLDLDASLGKGASAASAASSSPPSPALLSLLASSMAVTLPPLSIALLHKFSGYVNPICDSEGDVSRRTVSPDCLVFPIPPSTQARFRRARAAAEAGNANAITALAGCCVKGAGVRRDPAEAYRLCAQAVDLEHPRGTSLMGYLYTEGVGVDLNPSRAFHFYSKAVALGHQQSVTSVALAYSKGTGVAQDVARSAQLVSKAAETRQHVAVSNHGIHYLLGYGVARDPQKARALLMEAASLGYIRALGSLSAMSAVGKSGVSVDAHEAYMWALRSLMVGADDSFYLVSRMYEHGQYVKQDMDRAVKLLQLSAALESSTALLKLGQLYMQGKGVPRNPGKGFRLKLRAAVLRDVDAVIEVAEALMTGSGVEPDVSKGIEWLQLAVTRGSRVAMDKLAYCYLSGQGVPQDHSKAFELYHKAARLSHTNSMRRTGWCYETGTGVSPNPPMAFEWYKKAAEHDVPEAVADVAVCYHQGQGVVKDMDLAVQWYRRAVELNSPSAMVNLGRLYAAGTEVPGDVAQALALFSKAASMGHQDGLFQLGLLHANGKGVQKDEKKAAQLFTAAASKGSRDAMYFLGKWYISGSGGLPVDASASRKLFYEAAALGHMGGQQELERFIESMDPYENPSNAAEWYRKAAHVGILQSRFNYAVCLETGFGVAKDEKAALGEYFGVLQLADNTSAHHKVCCYALNNIGVYFELGRAGVRQDLKQAAEFYMKASSLSGNFIAKKNLAICFLNGRGVPLEKSTGAQMLTDAAKAGSRVAMKWLGVWYQYDARRQLASKQQAHRRVEEGKSLTSADSKHVSAVSWYTKAAELGHTDCMVLLGVCYEDGVGVARDPVKAVKLYRQAAAQGCSAAMVNLGLCLVKGLGVKVVDEEKAGAWFSRAAEMGDVDGMYNLGCCYNNGIGGPPDREKAEMWWAKSEAASSEKKSKSRSPRSD